MKIVASSDGAPTFEYHGGGFETPGELFKFTQEVSGLLNITQQWEDKNSDENAFALLR